MTQSTANLGSKYACSACGIKYYDLGRDEVRCPKCGAPPEPIGVASIVAKKKAAPKKGRKGETVYEPRLGEEVGDEEFIDEEFDEAGFEEDDFGEELPEDEEVVEDEEGEEAAEEDDE